MEKNIQKSLKIFLIYVGLRLCLLPIITSFLLVLFAVALHALPRFFDEREKFTLPDLSEWQYVRFLTTVDFPPFNYLDGSNILSGYHVDLARNICSELHIESKCQIEAVPWSDLALRLNQAPDREHQLEVVIAGLAPTAQNRMIFAFTRPYFHFPARFIALKRVDLVQMLDNMAVQRVGLVRSSAHEKMFTAYFPTVRPVLFEDYDALHHALEIQNIDLAFGDGMRFSFWLTDREDYGCCAFVGGAYFAPAYLGEGLRLAVSQRHAGLAEAFNHALQAMERKNKLKELYLKYFPHDFY